MSMLVIHFTFSFVAIPFYAFILSLFIVSDSLTSLHLTKSSVNIGGVNKSFIDNEKESFVISVS